MKKAFTLIELLIVVAIIAILAAIAVPNFLEAQTRSKVSRVYADMRTIVTALESYRVDNTDYPNPRAGWGQGAPNLTYEQRYAKLTTPISYLTSAPKDPFGKTWNPNARPAWAVWPTVDEGNPTGLYDYWTYQAATDNYTNLATPWNFPWNNNRRFAYQLRGLGPDELYEGNNQYTSGPWAGIVPPYDPTNGTVSRGDVMMWGPGGGTTGSPIR